MKHIASISIGLLLMLIALVACGGASSSPDLSQQQGNLEAQLSTVKRAQTATAQAIARAATVEAKATRQAIDAAHARSTTEAKQTQQAQAASTATVQAYAFQLTATANALLVAQQQAQATATAEAQAIIAAQQRAQATTTAQVEERARLKAERDAAEQRSIDNFFRYFWPVVTVLMTLIACWFTAVLLSQWITTLGFRRAVIETRTGTVYFIGNPREGYTPQLLNAPTLPTMTDDEFAASQAHTIEAEADTVTIRYANKTVVMPRDDPQDATAEANRKLAMRLLRAAMQQVGGQPKRLPTAKDLGWSPQTWVKAVSVLKPHVTTKEGRGGGTFCSEQYPTLLQLYSAVGERRVRLSPADARLTE